MSIDLIQIRYNDYGLMNHPPCHIHSHKNNFNFQGTVSLINPRAHLPIVSILAWKLKFPSRFLEIDVKIKPENLVRDLGFQTSPK
jgi:hypothetical protein